jgi:branched-chain amino acid transport system permease protein
VLAQLIWGAECARLDLGVQDEPIQWSPTTGNERFEVRLAAAGVAAILVTALALFFSCTRIGALRAVDDHQAALAVGIPLQQIWAIVWGVAGTVALVAGLPGARNGVQYALTSSRSRRCWCAIPAGSIDLALSSADSSRGAREAGRGVSRPVRRWRHRRPRSSRLALLFLLIRPEGCSARRSSGASDARIDALSRIRPVQDVA